MFSGYVFRFVVVICQLFYIATTTLHIYHVCIQTNIISDFQPEPGLKLSGYVQMFFTRETPDDIHTLVTSAHQLCDIFYKTIVMEGSEISQFDAILKKTIQAKDLNIFSSKTLVEKARTQFRKLLENVIFLETDILTLFIDYKRKSYIKNDGSVSDRKEYFDYFDEFLRIRRIQALDVNTRARAFNDAALKEENGAYFCLTVLLFVTAYGAILLVFLRKYIRYILICLLVVAILCSIYVNIQFEKSREFRAMAAKNAAQYHDIIQEIRKNQDRLLRSRNDTVLYFVHKADPIHVKQASFLLHFFADLLRRLKSIDADLNTIEADLNRMASLADSFEKSKSKKKETIMNDLRVTFSRIVKNVQTIFTIL